MKFKIIHIIFVVLLVIRNNIAKRKQVCESPIQVCNRDKISFWLFNHDEKAQPYHELILGNEDSIKNAPFIPNADIKFLMHGYNGARDAPPVMVDLRNEYLKLKKFNILVVDWGPLAKDGCYFDLSVPSVKLVGSCCADMVNAILKYRPEFKEDQIHIVSWSLGCHVAASFGNHFDPRIIARITGLEPALPMFEHMHSDPEYILYKKHAKFVDVFHTNVGVVGVWFSNATYEIYFNDPTFQPVCKQFHSVHSNFECDHRVSVEYFIESINSTTKFIAKKCKSNESFLRTRKCKGDSETRLEVGEYCKPPEKDEDAGTYHLETNDRSPYAKGPSGAK